jgi:hypothetical protein
MRKLLALMLGATLLGVPWRFAVADPWLAPGNEALRSDIQLLADAGIIRGPITTWPLSWPDISRDVLAAGDAKLDESTSAALIRVQRLAREASGRGFTGAGIRASGSHEPTELRSFADSPREEGELALRAGWLGDYAAVNLQAAVVADPDDDRQIRPDGSYLGVNVGNFMISAGWMERWWGPGWDGSLILSTNARPIPSLTLERNYTDPFKTKLLSWIGPWRASIAVGQAEEHDVAVAKVRFMAARVNFRPRPWLELGLTRTAQWCGEGRPCGWQSFKDMLLGQDNEVVDGSVDDQPGNQMAGYDMRLRSPWKALPVAFYTQWIGEDEAGGLPSKFLGLVGVEGWASTGWGGLRLRAEYADTTCTFTREEPDFNCAYRNGVYPQGYAYRGRVIGHSLDNDSRMWSLGALLGRLDGSSYSLTVRSARINRDGTGDHSISTVPLTLRNVELRHSREVGYGRINVGVGYDDREGGDSGSTVRGFVTWQQGF